MDFKHKLNKIVKINNSLLSVGLDPDLGKLPASFAKTPESLFEFNKAIIDATADLVCVYKLNSAMYERQGAGGIEQLHSTCAYIGENYPDIVVILDFKRGDIGNTNNYYAQFAFDYLGVDAITISPYMGKEANESYLAYQDKGIIILCQTSNPGAGEFQDLVIDGKKLYQIVAEHVISEWNYNNNCHMVIGATYPKQLAEIRQIAGDEVVFLVPGVGAQGGSLEQAVRAGINSKGDGLIINSSREIIFASSGQDFAEAARNKASELRGNINQFRGGDDG